MHADADADAEPEPAALVLTRALPHALAEELDETDALRVRHGDVLDEADEEGLRVAGDERDGRGLTLALCDCRELPVALGLARALRVAPAERVVDVLGTSDGAADADVESVRATEVLAAADAVGVVDAQLLCVALALTEQDPESTAVADVRLLSLIVALGHADGGGLTGGDELAVAAADSDVELLAQPLNVGLRVGLADARGDTEDDADADAPKDSVAPAESLAEPLAEAVAVPVGLPPGDTVAPADAVPQADPKAVGVCVVLLDAVARADLLADAAAVAEIVVRGERDTEAVIVFRADSVAALAVAPPEGVALAVPAAEALEESLADGLADGAAERDLLRVSDEDAGGDRLDVGVALLMRSAETLRGAVRDGLGLAVVLEMIEAVSSADTLAELLAEEELDGDVVACADPDPTASEAVGESDSSEEEVGDAEAATVDDALDDVLPSTAPPLPLANGLRVVRALGEVEALALTRGDVEGDELALSAVESDAVADERADLVVAGDALPVALKAGLEVADADSESAAVKVAAGVGDPDAAEEYDAVVESAADSDERAVLERAAVAEACVEEEAREL